LRCVFGRRFGTRRRKFFAGGGVAEAAEGEALFTAIEDLALSAGDAISRKVFEQQLE
jgi:hypothetical protein